MSVQNFFKARNDGREEAQAETRLTTTAKGSRNEQ